MKNLLDKLLFLGCILCLALVLSGFTKEGFECSIKNYPNIYENELIKGSMMDAGNMYQFSDALKEDENSTAEQIAAKEAEIGRERKISTQATRDLVRSLFQAQLLNATIEKSLKRQQNAIKKGAKANEAATGFAIDKQNKQQSLTAERLDLELALAEKTLGADKMKLALAGEFDQLSQTELETFAHIQEKKEEIAANDEKRIEDGEKIALVAQQTLEITKMTQQALVAEAQAAADLLKTTNQRANAARGV